MRKKTDLKRHKTQWDEFMVKKSFHCMGCIIALFGVLGCSKQSSEKPAPTFSMGPKGMMPYEETPSRPDDEPYVRQKRMLAFTNETDPVESWQPRTSPVFSYAASNYAESLRSRVKDLHRHQILAVEAGHMVRDVLQYPHSELDDESRSFVASVIFNQACALAETKHVDETFDALEAAAAVGFYDWKRITQSIRGLPIDHLPRWRKLEEMIQGQANKEIARQVKAARFGNSPRPLVLSPLTSLDGADFAPENHEWNVVCFVGSSYEASLEYASMLDSLQPLWKSNDVEFSVVFFEPASARRDANFVRRIVESKGIRLPTYLGEATHFRELQGLAGFPATIVVDRDLMLRAALRGYHSEEVIHGLLEAVTKEVP